MTDPATLTRVHDVLLVEDSQADVFLLETAIGLADIPLRLSVAEDGVLALEQLESSLRRDQLPDLILLDLNMPRMNGFEVLEALGAHPGLHALPVVVLTTSAAPIDRSRVQALGAKAFVTKPQGFTELAGLLEGLTAILRGQGSWASL